VRFQNTKHTAQGGHQKGGGLGTLFSMDGSGRPMSGEDTKGVNWEATRGNKGRKPKFSRRPVK